MSAAGDTNEAAVHDLEVTSTSIALRREPAYWHEHHTFVKERWLGRMLLEVMVTDFYQRTAPYYTWAIHKGICNVNGESKTPSYRLKQGDQLRNRVHRHEPPVTAEPIRIIDRNDELGRLVVVKPGSIPVHAAGRYNKLTLLELIRRELGIERIWTSNRLDRLTSGIMVCSTKKETAHKLSEDFAMGRVRKAYVCRVRGRFPDGEIACKEPLLQCDRQTGVSVVHPTGKECETLFNRMMYDADTNTSVVYCRPITGRTHQIRAHVQYLGHPIPNDPIYGHSIWNKYPPGSFKDLPLKAERWRVEPESSLDVYGSPEVDELVAGLKMDRDEKDDWSRWKDEIMFTELLAKEGIETVHVAGPNGESAAVQRTRVRSEQGIEGSPNEKEYCPECQVPLTPDPVSESELYIYLHAIKYQTEEWTYETDLPWWARKNWQRRGPGPVSKSAVVSEVKSQNKESLLGPAGRERSSRQEVAPLPAVRTIAQWKHSRQPLVPTPTDPCLCGVFFEVFGGMEDFAAVDIQQKVQAVLPNEQIGRPDVRLQTSHVAIPPGLAARAALDLFLSGHLYTVHKAYLRILDRAIPTQMLDTLQRERNEKATAQEGINRSKKARVRAKKAGKVVDSVESLRNSEEQLKVRTGTEVEMLELLRSAWVEAKEERKNALQEWRRATGIDREPTIEKKLYLRGRVDRSGYNLPTLKTTDIEKVVGSMTWSWLNGVGVDEGPWGVDLEEPDLAVVVKMLPGWCDGRDAVPYWRTKNHNLPGSFIYLIRLRPQQQAPHRPTLPTNLIEKGTVLARYRSYTLATALPLEPIGEGPLKVWEPCVGTGSIAIELDFALSQRQCDYQIFGSDLFEEEITKAKEICQLCHTSSRVVLDRVDGADLDACVTFLGGVEVLDAIITDLPWGRRVLDHMTISALYPNLLKVWVQVLKPGGTVLCMTAEQKTFLRAIKVHEADVRKKNSGWVLSVERVSTEGTERDTSFARDHERADRMRTVACGYDVSVIILRKRPLLD